MSVDVKIPAVGESITSGLISTWHKQDGEAVAAGEVLLTLETDKVSTELTAERAGVLRITAQAGQEVKIGEVVGRIEDAAGAAPSAPVEPSEKAPQESPPAPPEPQEKSKKVAPIEPAQPKPEAAKEHALPPPTATVQPPASQARPPERPAAERREGRTTRKRMSPIRRKIAAQLVMAQQTAAILTTFNECDMANVIALRTQMQESFTKEHGVKLGFMSFFVKAAVSALKAVPAVNSRLEGEDLVSNQYYNIGVAVGTERGLIVPVLRDAERKSFADIEIDIAEYAMSARSGKIKIEDLQGGVFTISNGGIYGSLLSTPILNPPQSGILGLHKIQERPIAIDGEVVVRPMMYLALSYDHRVVDGKEAVTFLIRIKECIENPARLMLDL